MKLNVTSEYLKDSDAIRVVVVVHTDEGNLTTRTVESGVCECKFNGQVLQSVSFDKTYGNKDGMFKLMFNHPTLTTAQVHVQVTMTDGQILDQIATTYVVEAVDTSLSENI